MTRGTATDRIFGMKVAAARVALGLTQTDLAKATSLRHQQTVLKVENGHRPATIGEAQELAAALNAALADLLDEGFEPAECGGCARLRSRVLKALGGEPE